MASKFVVGFIGLHGLVYGLDAVVKAAAVLTDFTEIHFLLIGDGPEKRQLQEQANRDSLSNISFFSTLPAARMPEIFTAIDVLLIPLRRDDLFKGTLPSKLFEAMGAGTPVIAALRGEAQQIIENADCGICVEPENVPAIVEAILNLFRDLPLRRKMGENGRAFVSNYYDRKKIAEQFESLLLAYHSTSSPLNEKVRPDNPKEKRLEQPANHLPTIHSKADD
jgi:glycosyltransferase involved in cell wall biosynthesis